MAILAVVDKFMNFTCFVSLIFYKLHTLKLKTKKFFHNNKKKVAINREKTPILIST